MKTLKLFSILLLSALIFNACSINEPLNEETEQSFIEESKENLKTQSDSSTTPEAKTKKTPTSQDASKTEGWSNQPELPAIDADETPQNETISFVVEFNTPNGIPLTPSQKFQARNRWSNYLGFVSYVVCSSNPEKEIWTLDIETYNDDTIPTPNCSGCPQYADPGVGIKDETVESDPDIEKAIASTTSNPCNE